MARKNDKNSNVDSTIFDFDRIHEVDLKKTMEEFYIDYAMSVIVARALPDVRDGLKPVQRRILYSMTELNNGPDKPHRKSARIVGDTMGKYHPHGDSSIYMAMVNMAQPWSMRYPLVDGHGNFGSIDGDGPAASRYTEARLSKISMEMIADLNKDTVDFEPNFDDTEKEPSVLPARFPNLLVNGGTGIAVGMATNIPPHNLREVINGVALMIDNRVREKRDTTVEELMECVKGPDFPTGAVILGRQGIEDAYRTGRGKIRIQAVSEIESMANGKHRIVFTEPPYEVNPEKAIKDIADLVKEKKIDGITELRNESNKDGIRLCVELRKDANPNLVLNQIYKHTELLTTYGVIMLALVNGVPKVLNLEQVLHAYLDHQEEVVTRRTKYDLNKAEERAHIIEGLLIALDNIDEVIKIVRGARTVQLAKDGLIARFGLSDAQAQAIVDMRLRVLTGLEREKLENEYADLMERIEEYRAILADENKLLGVIKEELLITAEKFGDERRTRIGADVGELTDEDTIPDVPTIIAMTSLGYIKRMSISNFRAQNRGGRGITGMKTLEEDYIEELFMTTTHHYIMFFTNKGKTYRLKTYEIQEASRTSRGVAIVNLIQLDPDEKITAMIPIKEYEEDKYFMMATRCGMAKKTAVTEYQNVRRNGLAAINLKDGDELIEVKITDGKQDVLEVTKMGQIIRFHESDVRTTGRVSMGVIGMKLEKGDEVVAMQLSNQGEDLLIVSELGLGKRTDMNEFTPQNRGGKGVKCYKINNKTGSVVGAKAVHDEQELMLITTEGIIIRIAINSISRLGRITSGVKLINMQKGIKVASIAKVREGDGSAENGEDVLPEEKE
ncbi:MAG: DNA gyrase subunit A [Lachnospiraceae bacterium]|nr:DNA gyrase subunit A [Lachnospiraceae bacterium]